MATGPIEESQDREGKGSASTEVGSQPNDVSKELEAKQLLDAIGNLNKRQEILISHLERYFNPKQDERPVEDSFGFEDLTAEELFEIEKHRKRFTDAIYWWPRYEERVQDSEDECKVDDEEANPQRLDVFRIFLAAYLSTGVRYRPDEEPKEEPNELQTLIDRYVGQIDKAYENKGFLFEKHTTLDRWGERTFANTMVRDEELAKFETAQHEATERWKAETEGGRTLTSLAPSFKWDVRTILYNYHGLPYEADMKGIGGTKVFHKVQIKDGRGEIYPNHIYKLHVRARFIPIIVLADLLCKISGFQIPSTERGQRCIPSLAKASAAFALSFIGGWSEIPTGLSLQFVDQEYYHIQYHMRILEVENEARLDARGYNVSNHIDPGNRHQYLSKDGGVYCERELGLFSQPNKRSRRSKTKYGDGYYEEISIIEARVSLAGITNITTMAPIFVIVQLLEHPVLLDDSAPLDARDWIKASMKPGRYYKGVATFQLILYQSLNKWAERWSRFLSEVDRGIQLKATDILDEKQRRRLLWENKDMKQFDLYLKLLQLFRIATQWILQSEADIARLSEDWAAAGDRRAVLMRSRSGWDRDESVIAENWKSLARRQKLLVEGLLNEIERKTKAITSLQDALSNATSVSEAIKSGELGRYIYIFTIATIVYLPISFVATFFSMDLVKGEFPWETTRSFIISFVTIPIGTYVLLFGFWANDKRRHEGFQWLRERKDILQKQWAILQIHLKFRWKLWQLSRLNLEKVWGLELRYAWKFRKLQLEKLWKLWGMGLERSRGLLEVRLGFLWKLTGLKLVKFWLLVKYLWRLGELWKLILQNWISSKTWITSKRWKLKLKYFWNSWKLRMIKLRLRWLEMIVGEDMSSGSEQSSGTSSTPDLGATAELPVHEVEQPEIRDNTNLFRRLLAKLLPRRQATGLSEPGQVEMSGGLTEAMQVSERNG
ncbi:hypothetical protein M426DRAFT_324473 [Hypoxylon sp. CI-4A]|nr:hypothetical protein M426DRAFT_324473 [Hypoxylon sp. CI-4A]